MGITNKVSMVENANPQTMTVATGLHTKDFPAKPIARENRPAIVVSEVIQTGITLLLAAYIVAFNTLRPLNKILLAVEISIIDALTDMPVSATAPYKLYRLSGLFVTHRPNTMPVNANGILIRINNGWE